MALINCIECKREISDHAKFCPQCGRPIKVAGKGFGTASLVLGIISCFYSLGLSAIAFDPETKTIGDAGVMLITYIMIMTILSFIFGLLSHKRGCKLGRKTAGIVLSIISFAAIILSIIIAIF